MAAARNMLGAQAAYDRLPYFYSDQHDLGMEYHGHGAPWDDVVIRGDPAGREFIAFWLRRDRVVAAMKSTSGTWRRALIRAGAPVHVHRLADTAVALADLLSAAARDALIVSTLHHSRFPAGRLRMECFETVSVCVVSYNAVKRRAEAARRAELRRQRGRERRKAVICAAANR